MKIAVAFLLVAFSCYFDLASASCMRRCASCQQTHIANLKCLQGALARNKVATIRAIADVLCAYVRCKAMRNKMELIKALRVLQECAPCDLLGYFTVNELNADVDNVMEDALRAMLDVLRPLNIGSLSTPLCGPLGPLVTKVTQMLYTRGSPSLDGIWNVAGINGGKPLLGTVANVSPPGLVNLVLELLLGNEKGLLSGVTGTTSVVTGLTDSKAGLLSNLLRVLTGSIGGITGGLGNSLGSLTGSIGDITGGLGNSLGSLTGSIGDITGGLGKSLGSLTGSIGDITGGLTHSFEELTPSVGGLTRGITVGLGNSLGELTGSNAPIWEMTRSIPDIAGGLSDSLSITGELLKPLGELTTSVGSMTGLKGDVKDLYVNPVGVFASEAVDKNGRIYANSEINGDSYGGSLTGGMSGRFFARPGLTSSVSTAQNPGLQGDVYGDFAGGIGSYPTRKSYSLFGL